MNYDSAELSLLIGKSAKDFTAILGRPSAEEIIHRDNLTRLVATEARLHPAPASYL